MEQSFHSVQRCSYYNINVSYWYTVAWGRDTLLRLVFLDDEVNSLMLFKQIMTSNNRDLDIKLSTSPEEALEWVLENETDCILSDYNMPEMNGVEFTRKLREVSQIPVILYTNQSKDDVLDQAFEAGVSDYVQKENDAMHYILLLRRIMNAVDKHRLEMMNRREASIK